jgi:hypothetical protein
MGKYIVLGNKMHFGAYKGKTSTEVREEESKSRL